MSQIPLRKHKNKGNQGVIFNQYQEWDSFIKVYRVWQSEGSRY